MKCPKCNGEVRYIEDYSATGYYRVVGEDEETIVVKHIEDENFNTHSIALRCEECSHEIKIDKNIDFE